MWCKDDDAVLSKPCEFFFLTLKTGSQEDIIKMFNSFRADVRNTIQAVIQLVYFMRGSVSYNDMMKLSYMEREMIGEFVSGRLEQESKRMSPVY